MVYETDCIGRVELMLQRFRDLGHENVIKICKVFDDGDIAHLVRGPRPSRLQLEEDLYTQMWTSKHHRLSELRASHFFSQLLHGLIYLRSQQVLYKIVRPENMLITDTSTLKLCAVEGVMCCMQRRLGYKSKQSA